ncbi:hypothetical protein ES332_A02G007800v1 [Gossypium tomentosum]|uniref:RCK N-terminal domain-containing protein n=1 Tax=Gossypium tomentosum TaxID=34277 RepID=A0A5D2RE95_GOSTO|nr:hypothetical protein ES332_A02G007800v1 [Gossypium tomentosum]
MSLDSAEASPSSSRDWFFPSPSFIHSTSNSPQSPNYPRKFSTIPRHSRSSHTDWKPPKTSTFRSVSSSGSAAYGDPKYGRVRRRIELRRREKMAKQEKEDPVLEQKRDVSKAVSGVKTAIGEMGIRDFGQRVKIRWQMASYIAILITAFGSLVHKNFSLHNQVIDLQDQISTMNIRLQACNTSDTFDTISILQEGNHANSEGMGPRLVSVSISFGGMLIFAMMLGLVSDAISEKLDSLRKGRSEVVEQNHTLILGWSDKLGSLLNQLVIANESLGGGIVVVMAERDKEEMELDIAKMEFDFRGTSVICRSGSPLILADLKKVSVSKARAIVVLADDGNADQSDARALRTVLSLTGVKEGLRGHIVVELSDLDNEVLVKLVGGELVETVVAHDVIGRLMIQCARQPGLAQIWEDILGFENCEFYIKRWPQLDGMQFEDVLISFPDAIPCGVKVASRGGKIILNPEDSYVLQGGDEVLVIAEDDDTYAPGALPMVNGASFMHIARPARKPQKILLCGWRRDVDDMIVVLDAFLAPGSELWMFNEVVESERERKLIDGGLDLSRLVNITLVHREGNAVIRRHLESLPLESFDSAKRLPYREAMVTRGQRGSFSRGSWIGEMQQASDRSVIISEILDPRTKNLLSMSKISDYVLSNELVSMALAMVAEDRQINDVLEELFAEEGNELHIRLAELYLHEGEEMSFYEVILRARQKREIVIGYRLENAERAVINPPNKNERRRWSVKDVFVVITEKE